jgi:hypothetical protein
VIEGDDRYLPETKQKGESSFPAVHRIVILFSLGEEIGHANLVAILGRAVVALSRYKLVN